MKKFLAIFLCVVMMTVMIPSFFASAAELPEQEAVVVAADGEGDTGQVDNSLVGPLETLKQFFELFFGGLKTVFGEDFLQKLLPALKKLLNVVPISDFGNIFKRIFESISGC